METTEIRPMLTAPEIRARLKITNPAQFARVLPKLIEFGAFKPTGIQWRMYVDDFERYLSTMRAESVGRLAERRAQ